MCSTAQEGETRRSESGTLLGLLVVEGTALGAASASPDSSFDEDHRYQQPPVALAPPAVLPGPRDSHDSHLAALLLEQVPRRHRCSSAVLQRYQSASWRSRGPLVSGAPNAELGAM